MEIREKGFSYIPFRQLEKRWKQITPQLNSLNGLKKEAEGLVDKEKRYQELTTPKAVLCRAFADIYVSLPQNIWFEKIRFADKKLTISG